VADPINRSDDAVNTTEYKVSKLMILLLNGAIPFIVTLLNPDLLVGDIQSGVSLKSNTALCNE
jgi:hypothetical protein